MASMWLPSVTLLLALGRMRRAISNSLVYDYRMLLSFYHRVSVSTSNYPFNDIPCSNYKDKHGKRTSRCSKPVVFFVIV